eukprot:1186621-Prorocentrum_minimum.AAC.2
MSCVGLPFPPAPDRRDEGMAHGMRQVLAGGERRRGRRRQGAPALPLRRAVEEPDRQKAVCRGCGTRKLHQEHKLPRQRSLAHTIWTLDRADSLETFHRLTMTRECESAAA